MRYSASILALAAPLFVSAAPALTRRAAADILVFKFADVLEQLETQFYTQALAKFQDSDFQAAGFVSTQVPLQQFQNIMSDESTHSTVLQSAIVALGATPITNCQFDFSSVLTDVNTMANTARLVENVGVGAYLGGATLLTDPVLLDSAASILTVEARHQTVLNILTGGSAIPSAFDIALAPSEVLAIASPFISGCDVGIPANPVLSITNTGTVTVGTQLSFSSAALNSSVSQDGFYCQMMLGGQPFSIALPLGECIVPPGINGPVAIFITSDGQPLLNNVVDRATTQLIAGPTMAFIDTQPEMLGMMLRTSSSNSSGSNTAAASVSTQTISPADAQSIIDSSSATATAAATTSSSTPVAVTDLNSPGEVNGSSDTFTGVSPDGDTTVNGVSAIPAVPAPSASAT